MDSQNVLVNFALPARDNPLEQRSSEGEPAGQPGKDPRENKKYYTHMTPFRAIATPIILGVYRLLASVKVEGSGHLPPSGAVILAANHLTNYDVYPLQLAFSRPIFFMAKAELHQNAIFDWGLRQMGSFPVERGTRDEWAMRHAARVLRAEQVLGMFPEGKRSKGHGLATAKTGVARLALESGCPILPVALHGPQYMFRRVSGRTAVIVTAGKPIYPEHGETVLELTDRLMFTIADMLPPEQRGVYRLRPVGF